MRGGVSTGATRTTRLKRERTQAAIALAFACFLPACQAEPEAQEDVASPLIFRNAVIGQYSRLPCSGSQDLRCQVADIADVGPNRFVVGYIDGSGNLKYTYQHTTGGQEVAPFTKGTSAMWVRASTSKSWNAFGCDINYFAVQVTDASSGPGVFLDEFSRCGSTWTLRRTLVASLSASVRGIPAVATKGTPLWGDLLFAWNSPTGFVGRLHRFRHQNPGGGWTSNFGITAANFSSDLIYNSRSNRWIVGGMLAHVSMGYATENVVLSSADNALPAEVARMSAGASGDGHHTSVAYNPLSSDGSYVWWYESAVAAKAVHVHDQNGRRIPTPLPENPNLPGFPTTAATQDPPSTGNRWTTPVSPTNSASIPYVFLKASGFYGLRSDKTWMLLEERPQEAAENTPLAVRSLGTETVGLFGAEPSGNIRLVVSDAPGSQHVSSGMNWMGFVNAYFTGAGDRLYKAVQTSFGGSEGWTSSPIIDGVTHTATQIEQWTDLNSRQHIVYLGTDNVLRQIRETGSGSDTYQDLGLVSGSAIRAKRFALTSHNNGGVIVVYARYPDDVLCYTRQTASGSSTWTAESTLAGATTKARQIATGGGPDGIRQIVFTGTDDVLWTTWQTAQSSDAWTPPSFVQSSTTTARELLLTARFGSDLPELIYTIKSGGADGYLVQTKQTSRGSWTAATIFATTSAKQMSAGYALGGHLQLVFVSSTDALKQMIRDPSSGAWSGISSLPSPAAKAKRVSVNRNGWDGRLEVFFVGLDDVAYRTSQTLSNLGPTDFYPPVPL
jgi:hypothetical protein